MGRAGGWLLALLVQELGPAYLDEDHGFSIRPPAAWGRRETGAGSIGFAPQDRSAPPVSLKVTHYSTTNPTPLKSFVSQAREFLEKEFPGARFLEEKELKVGGRPAFRLAFSCRGALQIKTIVHRTNLQYYLLDAQMPETEASRCRPVVEASLETLEVRPFRLTAEEREAHDRFLSRLRAGLALPGGGGGGEEWQAVMLGRQRIGRQRVKIAPADNLVLFEQDITSDFGGGNRDSSVIRGRFSLDAKIQQVEAERTKENPQERWRFRASGRIEGGRVRVSRDMNGAREEAELAAEEGILFEDVASIVQRLLAAAGPGGFLIRGLSLYEDEPGLWALEVSGRETMEISGRRQEAVVVFRRRDRRRTDTYYYSPDGRLIREGGLKELFFLQAVSREEFEKP